MGPSKSDMDMVRRSKDITISEETLDLFPKGSFLQPLIFALQFPSLRELVFYSR